MQPLRDAGPGRASHRPCGTYGADPARRAGPPMQHRLICPADSPHRRTQVPPEEPGERWGDRHVPPLSLGAGFEAPVFAAGAAPAPVARTTASWRTVRMHISLPTPDAELWLLT
jgi:hypothetical protein